MNKRQQSKAQKAQDILEKLVKEIITGGVIDYVRSRVTRFNDGQNIPCDEWSLLNRLITFFNKTNDARGIQQWKAVGRTIKKNARAFHI
ncbi:MAG: hypothetical protein ACRC5H_01065, partial [Treponemataceae bacterium]